MNGVSEANEQVELNKILQSLLQVNGSLKRLNIETDEVYGDTVDTEHVLLAVDEVLQKQGLSIEVLKYKIEA